MPYRRLPKTDAARLRALKTLLDNNDVYVVRNRFIDWKTLNQAQPLYDKLFTACGQYRICQQTQKRHTPEINKHQHKAIMYVSHFMQVLLMAVERGEIKRSMLPLYGLQADATTLPNIKQTEALSEWGTKVINGEKARLKMGGRPIYNPTIGMVSTHYDIFKDAFNRHKMLMAKTQEALAGIQNLRPKVDQLLLELWNQIEAHFEKEPPQVRYEACRKFGIIYYYRRNEPKDD
ncbi:MAG TPA: hypothetical protein VIQ97_02925 [Prevotella sp.]